MKELALLCLALGGLSLPAATIDRVVVRQMWPWQGSIHVEYKISGVTAPVDVRVTLSENGRVLPLPDAAFSGERLSVCQDGIYSIDVTPSAEQMPNRINALKVSLEPVAASVSEGEAIYRIYDLVSGACEDVTVGDIVSGRMGSWRWANDASAKLEPGVANAAVATNLVWTGVAEDDAYRTDKLVLRRVPAGSVNLLNRANKKGTIEKPFWIAVFETTQAQWKKIHGSEPLFGYFGDKKPASNIKYDDVRGAKGPEGEEAKYYWPNDPDPDSFLGKLRAKTGVKFDLPWQGLWEYACQINSGWALMNDRVCVGTYNTNVPVGTENGQFSYKDESGKDIGWPTDPNFPGTYLGNSGPTTEAPGYAVVGSFAPNVIGLYDMHGNVTEMCVDWSNGYVRQSDQANLKGAANVDLTDPTKMREWDTTQSAVGTTRHCGGSSYTTTLADQTPNYTRKNCIGQSTASVTTGFRLVVIDED